MESLKYLYTDFLYRDVLSYILPGAIALLGIDHAFGANTSTDSASKIVAFLALAYLVGLLLQSIGTLMAGRKWWPLLSMYPTSNEVMRRKSFVDQDRTYNEETLKAIAPPERAAYLMKRLERFSALKQVHGNSAMALLVLALCILIRGLWPKRDWTHVTAACLLFFSFFVFLQEHRKLRLKEHVWRELMSKEWKRNP